jgi:thioredoxin-related protein
MNKKHIILYSVIIGVIGLAGLRIHSSALDLVSLSKMPERNSSAPYDGDARIAQAIKIARQTGKLVLIQSSAQGCTWCHVMHKVLTTDTNVVAKIESGFVYVLVDTTNDQNRDFYKKYADGTDHTLVLIVMDADGKQLVRKIGGECVDGDEGHYHVSPDSVLKFLDSALLKKDHDA